MIDAERRAALDAAHVNVADLRLGAAALYCTDDFFAPMQRLLAPHEPEWRAGVYDDHGKWMDGWESRRRRGTGNDHCVIKLAGPSTLAALDIDTRFFTGNFPPFASVDACHSVTPPDAAAAWVEVLPRSALGGNQSNLFTVHSTAVWTHLRLNIFPDGGVARFRVFGALQPDWQMLGVEDIDLAAALHGGRALACSDEHYGSMGNLLLPGRGSSMADGWETRRRREPGFDWVILRLGHPGRIAAVEADTAHFKGNFPHQLSINAALLTEPGDADLRSQCLYWPELLAPQPLAADAVARFAELRDVGPVSHVRVNIHPDGGLSRVRLWGRPERGR